MKTIPRIVSVWFITLFVVGLARSQDPLSESAHLEPFPEENRTDEWNFTLEPKQSATYTVSIASSGTSPEDHVYNLVQSSITVSVSPDYNQNILWAWQVTGSGQSYVCDIVNTVWVANEALVHIKCRWDREVSGGAALGAAGFAIHPIYGSAFGLATHNQSEFEVSSSVEIDGAPEYLCINDVLDLYAWLVIGDHPYEDSQLVDADWSVEASGSEGGGGYFLEEMQTSTVTFVPTNAGTVKVTATVPGSSPTLTGEVEFTIVKVTIETESEPKEFLCKGGAKIYTAEVLPPGISGEFTWHVSDEENLDFVNDENTGQTVTVTGKQASASLGVEKLTVEFRVNDDLICEPSTNLTMVKVEFLEDDDSVYNFSPALGEQAKFKVRVMPTPPSGGFPDVYFKLRIIRELKSGSFQPIDRINLSDDPGLISDERDLDFGTKTWNWNGIPSSFFGDSADQAEGPAEFDGVNTNFHRLLPDVSQGEPVPPPIYTAVATIYKSADNSVCYEAEQSVYVPQVVLLELSEEAEEELLQQMDYSKDPSVLIAAAFAQPDIDSLLDNIADGADDYFGSEANIRFVTTEDNLSGLFSRITLKNEHPSRSNTLGQVEVSTDFGNVIIDDRANVFVKGIRNAVHQRHHWSTLEDPLYPGTYWADPIDLPVTVQEQIYSHTRTTTHEQGHLLGLVKQNQVLLGNFTNHNPLPFYPRRIMNASIYYITDGDEWRDSLEAKLHRDVDEDDQGSWTWRPRNKSYLEFILPNYVGD